MKRVDSRVISEPVEFILNLLNVVVTNETVRFIPNTLHIHIMANII